jgi:predicted RNA-binding protein YlqC (UPF0109 family)
MRIQEVIQAFVKNLVENLVDEKEEVSIDVSVSTKTVLVQIKTAKSDTGKVIGKRGKTIDAIKIITLAAKNTNFPGDSKNVSVEILEDETEGSNFFKKND